ncbi:hypothetical protein PO78_2936 [Thauera sp. SWB20]|nr:hypothetical protein PO78_2936 [Thauera sp. SWB20]
MVSDCHYAVQSDSALIEDFPLRVVFGMRSCIVTGH